MENINNIFLIGMMGSWKSTVGQKLALNKTIQFVDTDQAIEKIMSMKISEIYDEFGEEKFREMESSYFIEKSKQTGFIFSTGGGIVLGKKNRNILQSNGICFLLNASPKILASRIKNIEKRPLLNNVEDIEKQLIKIWNKRKKLYNSSAHYTINTENIKPNEIVLQILKILTFHENN